MKYVILDIIELKYSINKTTKHYFRKNKESLFFNEIELSNYLKKEFNTDVFPYNESLMIGGDTNDHWSEYTILRFSNFIIINISYGYDKIIEYYKKKLLSESLFMEAIGIDYIKSEDRNEILKSLL